MDGFDCVYCKRDVVVVLKSGLDFEVMRNFCRFGDDYEMIVVRICGLLLVGCYLKVGQRVGGISALLELLGDLESAGFRDIVVAGDLNAKMRSLGNVVSNAAGVLLER